MKKIILFICLILCFSKNTYALGLDFNEYELEISKVSFEIYDEDSFMYEGEDSLKMYWYPTYSEDVDISQINETIKEDIWIMGTEKDVNIIDLNIDTSKYLEKFELTKPIDDKNYMAVLMVYYNYKNIPNNLNSIYHINYMEVLLNSFNAAFSGEEYKLQRKEIGDSIKVPIWFSVYNNDTEEYIECDSLETMEEIEEDEVIMLFNYDMISEEDEEFLSDELPYNFENNIIVNYEVDILKNYFMEISRPTIYVEDSDYKSYVTLQTNSSYNEQETCYLYRSNNKYSNFQKIGEIKCSDVFTDNNIQASMTYYYKTLDTVNNLESNVLEYKTHAIIESDDIVIENTEQDKNSENKQEQTNNDKQQQEDKINGTQDDKITGTVEGEKLGLNNNIIFLIGFLLVAIIISLKNKNYLKSRL